MNSNFIPLAVAAAVGFAVFQNWPAIKGTAAQLGVDLSHLGSMRLDPNVRDAIDDRRGEPASWPGGYGRGGPPITDNPSGDGYQGRQGGEPPPMPRPPCPPGRSSRRPPPGGPSGDASDWWDDERFGPERGQGRWRDCGAGGRRCGPWRDGPMPGDPIHEDPKWRGR